MYDRATETGRATLTCVLDDDHGNGGISSRHSSESGPNDGRAKAPSPTKPPLAVSLGLEEKCPTFKSLGSQDETQIKSAAWRNKLRRHSRRKATLRKKTSR